MITSWRCTLKQCCQTWSQLSDFMCMAVERWKHFILKQSILHVLPQVIEWIVDPPTPPHHNFCRKTYCSNFEGLSIFLLLKFFFVYFMLLRLLFFMVLIFPFLLEFETWRLRPLGHHCRSCCSDILPPSHHGWVMWEHIWSSLFGTLWNIQGLDVKGDLMRPLYHLEKILNEV